MGNNFYKNVEKAAKSALQGKLLPENAEFEKGYARVLEVRKDLSAIETGVKKWLSSARALSTNAKILAKAVRTPEREIAALVAEMEALLDDLIVLKSVTKKIGILDDLMKQRYHLKDLRVAKEAHEKRLQQLEEQDKQLSANPQNAGIIKDHDVQKKILQDKIAAATETYQTHLVELTAAVNFFVEEAGVEGGTKLLAPELSAFRSSQFQFFLLCQKLIAGKDVDIQDLEAQWKAFARRMSTDVANARSNSRKAKDGEPHVLWNQKLIEPIPTNGKNQSVNSVSIPASAMVPALQQEEEKAQKKISNTEDSRDDTTQSLNREESLAVNVEVQEEEEVGPKD